ncbi:MAG: hypothetical protein ACI4TV_03255 [Paludibacteraceae bacterium]
MYYLLVIFSVLTAAGAQMLLKRGADRAYHAWWHQYFNGYVIAGYAIMFACMALNIVAMSHGVKLKEVSIIESLSYLFVPLLSFLIFKEKLTGTRIVAISVIIVGIIVFFT